MLIMGLFLISRLSLFRIKEVRQENETILSTPVLGPLVTYYGHANKVSTSGEVRFQWYDMKTQKIIKPDDQYAWFWAMPKNVPSDPVVTDKWVKFVQGNLDSVFKIIGTRNKDDCDYWGPDHCVENIDIKTIDVVDTDKSMEF